MCSSPRLFAACHVLRRLLMPRHSPCALFSLTCFWFSLSSLNYADNLQKFCKIVFYPLIRKFSTFFYASSKCFHLSVALLSCFSFSVQFSRCSFRFLLKADTNHQILIACIRIQKKWWAQVGSNHRPYDYQSYALAS